MQQVALEEKKVAEQLVESPSHGYGPKVTKCVRDKAFAEGGEFRNKPENVCLPQKKKPLTREMLLQRQGFFICKRFATSPSYYRAMTCYISFLSTRNVVASLRSSVIIYEKHILCFRRH